MGKLHHPMCKNKNTCPVQKSTIPYPSGLQKNDSLFCTYWGNLGHGNVKIKKYFR